MLFTSEMFLYVIVIILFLIICNKATNAICKSQKKLHGKTTLVTGGSSGMGLEIAKDFARRGARVIIACPFNDEGEKARKIISEQTGNQNVVFKNLDLGSFNSVRDFAADILKAEDRLDILMNNAGIINFRFFGMATSIDGLNPILQVNYYGHFLLTQLLLPLLKKSAPSRVINTCSLLHRIGKINVAQMNHWCPIKIYGNSKLCLVYYAREFGRRFEDSGVTMNNVDPGMVGTPIVHTLVGDMLGNILSSCIKVVSKTPSEGAQTAIYVALEDSLEKVSGEYFANCKVGRASSWAYCEENARLLWDQSVKICKLVGEQSYY